MVTRLDAVTPRPKRGGGTFWHRVGTGWVQDDGKINITLDSIPLPDPKDHVIKIMLFEPRDGERPARSGGDDKRGGGQQRPLAEELDDEIPF